MFGISRQALYQGKQWAIQRQEELSKIRPLIVAKRMRMPRLETRKLYHFLADQFERLGVKLDRYALFDYLREEKILIRPL